MNPEQVGAVMRFAGRALEVGTMTAKAHALLHAMIFRCRAPGCALLSASYPKLMKMAHSARDTVAKCLAQLEQLGVLRRTKTRVRVAWLGGTASRQGTNTYEILVPHTASGSQTAFRGLVQNPVPSVERNARAPACEPAKPAQGAREPAQQPAQPAQRPSWLKAACDAVALQAHAVWKAEKAEAEREAQWRARKHWRAKGDDY